MTWPDQNEQIAPIHANYVAAATVQATRPTPPDCLIAAIAVRLQLRLITGNTGDFRAIQETGIKLTIGNWREA